MRSSGLFNSLRPCFSRAFKHAFLNSSLFSKANRLNFTVMFNTYWSYPLSWWPVAWTCPYSMLKLPLTSTRAFKYAVCFFFCLSTRHEGKRALSHGREPRSLWDDNECCLHWKASPSSLKELAQAWSLNQLWRGLTGANYSRSELIVTFCSPIRLQYVICVCMD